MRRVFLCAGVAALAAGLASPAADEDGFVSLFNGKDLTGWKVPEGDNGHWKVVNGVIDYDARSEAKGDKSLYTERKFRDYVLKVDWRLKTDEPGYMNPNVKQVLPDGSDKKGPDGKDIRADCVFEGTSGTILVSRGSLSSTPGDILKTPIGEKDKRVYPSNNHHGNWLDCIRTGKDCICTAETGHRTASICHLGNIGYRLGRKLN